MSENPKWTTINKEEQQKARDAQAAKSPEHPLKGIPEYDNVRGVEMRIDGTIHEQPVELPKKRTYSDIAEEHLYAKGNLEDKMLEFGMTDWDRVWTDPYDNSIEFGDVEIDNRLSPEAQQYLRDEGFSTCWLNHKDNMETAYYKLDGSEGSRRPAAPHRCKPISPKRESGELDLLKIKVRALFGAIAHGDEKHRSWLKDAINTHFEGHL